MAGVQPDEDRDVISIELNPRERHVLRHLLQTYIIGRVREMVRADDGAVGLLEASKHTNLVAHLLDLTDDSDRLPLALAKEARLYLARWLEEAQIASIEHEGIVKALGSDLDRDEVAESVQRLRGLVVEDFAHECVCRRVVQIIDADRAARDAGALVKPLL